MSSYRAQAGSLNQVPGGLWDTTVAEEQEEILAGKLYRLIYFLTLYRVPVTFLHFPTLADDADYLFEKLKGIFGIGNRKNFERVFNDIRRGDLIHDFDKHG